MKTVVITGSTRGIGYGLAQSFLSRGCQVVVSGRRQHSVDEVVVRLGAQYSRERVCGAQYPRERVYEKACFVKYAQYRYW